MQDCGMSCIKYLLFIFNFLFTLSGIALIVVGGCLLNDEQRFKTFIQNTFLALPIVLLVVGCIVFVVSFMGCCGAIKESPCMLSCFAALLFVIFVAEMAVGIFSASNKEPFLKEMHKTMKLAKDSYDPSLPQDRKLWDEIQSGLECCGVDGPDDWAMGGVYPASCCIGFDPKLHQDHLCQFREFVHKIGCFEKLQIKMKEQSEIILGVAVGIAFLQITGMVLACILASEITNERRKEGRRRRR